MKIAFLISAHTDAQHLKRLTEVLPKGSDFYIHIDKKSDIDLFLSVLPASEHVIYLDHRVNVVWGSMNEVEYQMELIRAALDSGTGYDRLVTLSGMDYPLWSNERIVRYFQECEDKELLCGMCMTNQKHGADLYRQYRFFTSRPWAKGTIKSKFRVACRKVVFALGVRKPLVFTNSRGESTKLYKGAAWWAITPALAAVLLEKWDKDEAYHKYFDTSFGPAETFSQTVAFNSPFAEKCMLVDGEFQNLPALTPLTYIYYKPGFVRMLTEEDFPLLQADDKMFCRKVVTGRSDKLMRLIDDIR